MAVEEGHNGEATSAALERVSSFYPDRQGNYLPVCE